MKLVDTVGTTPVYSSVIMIQNESKLLSRYNIGKTGYFAYLPGFTKMWQKDFSGNWIVIGGES